MNDAPDSSTEPSAPGEGASSLRGTMTAVLVMAAFFVACWLGIWALHVHRR